MKRLGIQIFHNTQYYQKYSLILDMNWSAIPFLIHRVWKKKTWRKRRTQQGNGNLNIPKQLSGCTLTSWSAAAPWCMWYMFTCRSKFQRWCIEAARGLKCICISLFQSTSFASSAAVFLINMKQNVLVWQPQQVVLLKKERQKKKITAFFPLLPLSSPIFLFLQLTEFCNTHLTWVLLFSCICKHFRAFVAVQVHSSVCGLQRWLFDCLISKTYRQWQLHPSACLTDGQAFADGVTIHRHVCALASSVIIPVTSRFLFFTLFFYPIPLTLTSGNTVNITLLLLH